MSVVEILELSIFKKRVRHIDVKYNFKYWYSSTQFIIKVLSIINSIIMVDCVIIWWQLSFAFSSSFWQMVSRNCHKPHINLRFLDAEKAFLLWYVWPIYFYQWDFKKIMWLFLTTMQFATWKRRRKAIEMSTCILILSKESFILIYSPP